MDAYDLILKKKGSLLSFEEPVRFIFSHSALREGWDNPNVFIICALKHSDNTVSRRQEVGRGLRLSVNQNGDRMDNPATVPSGQRAHGGCQQELQGFCRGSATRHRRLAVRPPTGRGRSVFSPARF